MTTMYCPACGETGEIEPIEDVSPDLLVAVKCANCGTKFNLFIEYQDIIE